MQKHSPYLRLQRTINYLSTTLKRFSFVSQFKCLFKSIAVSTHELMNLYLRLWPTEYAITDQSTCVVLAIYQPDARPLLGNTKPEVFKGQCKPRLSIRFSILQMTNFVFVLGISSCGFVGIQIIEWNRSRFATI